MMKNYGYWVFQFRFFRQSKHLRRKNYLLDKCFCSTHSFAFFAQLILIELQHFHDKPTNLSALANDLSISFNSLSLPLFCLEVQPSWDRITSRKIATAHFICCFCNKLDGTVLIPLVLRFGVCHFAPIVLHCFLKTFLFLDHFTVSKCVCSCTLYFFLEIRLPFFVVKKRYKENLFKVD